MTVCRWADVHKANKLMNQMGQKDAQLVMSSVSANFQLLLRLSKKVQITGLHLSTLSFYQAFKLT